MSNPTAPPTPEDQPNTAKPTPACNGICLTAYDIGIAVAGNPVAYPHPECELHA